VANQVLTEDLHGWTPARSQKKTKEELVQEFWEEAGFPTKLSRYGSRGVCKVAVVMRRSVWCFLVQVAGDRGIGGGGLLILGAWRDRDGI